MTFKLVSYLKFVKTWIIRRWNVLYFLLDSVIFKYGGKTGSDSNFAILMCTIVKIGTSLILVPEKSFLWYDFDILGFFGQNSDSR